MRRHEIPCYKCNDLKPYNKFHFSSDDPLMQVCDDCKVSLTAASDTSEPSSTTVVKFLIEVDVSGRSESAERIRSLLYDKFDQAIVDLLEVPITYKIETGNHL